MKLDGNDFEFDKLLKHILEGRIIVNMLSRTFYRFQAFVMKLKLHKKAIFEYKMLEKFNIINIDRILKWNLQSLFGEIRVIDECDKYIFYGFTPILLEFKSDEYILRMSKINPCEVVYFGKSSDNVFIFDDIIIQCDNGLDVIHNDKQIICKNIYTGFTNTYCWFRKAEISNGGHFSNYDYINDIIIKNNKIIFDVGRYIGNFVNYDPLYDSETDYFLIVSKHGDKFETLLIEEHILKDAENSSVEKEKNSITIFNGQCINENYGCLPSNPVCASGLSGSRNYLGKLYTVENDKVLWVWSKSVYTPICNGVEDVYVDEYKLYSNGEFLKYLYICTSSKNTCNTPKGLMLKNEVDPKYKNGDLKMLARNYSFTVEQYLYFKAHK